MDGSGILESVRELTVFRVVLAEREGSSYSLGRSKVRLEVWADAVVAISPRRAQMLKRSGAVERCMAGLRVGPHIADDAHLIRGHAGADLEEQEDVLVFLAATDDFIITGRQ